MDEDKECDKYRSLFYHFLSAQNKKVIQDGSVDVDVRHVLSRTTQF